MDILSKDTLALLRDTDLRKAIEEVLNAKTEDTRSSTQVVNVQRDTPDNSDAHCEPTQVTVRRIA
jgi:hypothetical protein